MAKRSLLFLLFMLLLLLLFSRMVVHSSSRSHSSSSRRRGGVFTITNEAHTLGVAGAGAADLLLGVLGTTALAKDAVQLIKVVVLLEVVEVVVVVVVVVLRMMLLIKTTSTSTITGATATLIVAKVRRLEVLLQCILRLEAARAARENALVQIGAHVVLADVSLQPLLRRLHAVHSAALPQADELHARGGGLLGILC